MPLGAVHPNTRHRRSVRCHAFPKPAIQGPKHPLLFVKEKVQKAMELVVKAARKGTKTASAAAKEALGTGE